MTSFSPVVGGGQFDEDFHDGGSLGTAVEASEGVDTGFLDRFIISGESFDADFEKFYWAVHFGEGGKDTATEEPVIVLDEGGGQVGKGNAAKKREGVGGFGADAGGVVEFHQFEEGLEAAIGVMFGEGHGDEGANEEFAIGELVNQDRDGNFGRIMMKGLDSFETRLKIFLL